MKLLERYFDTAFDAPDGIKKLRELILTLAMQGKLVPQNPIDRSASELLKEIETEKKRLVKQGKIKEFYPILALRSENAPYNLPDGWEWVKLGLIALIERGGSPRPINAFLTHEQDGLNWIKIGDTQKGGKFITATSEKIRPEGLSKTRMVYPGDFLLTNSMSFGRPYITQIEGCIHDGWLRISPPESVNKDYLYHLLSSSFVRSLFETAAAGAVVQNLNADKVRELPIPLPPLNEQARIVARIDELMARCDALEKLKAERDAKRLAVHTAAVRQLLDVADTDGHIRARDFLGQHFDELYTVKENVTELRKTILQLAVMGKLVPQDPNDSPARELLKEIETKKRRLVKDGKIKEPKPLLMIAAEEIPFELPAEWAWIRFFAVNDVKSELVSASDFPDENQIAPDSIEKGTGRLLFNRSVSESGAIGPNNRFYKGQILYSKIRPSLNKVTIAPYDGLCSADMYPINTYVNSAYMHQVMLSEVFLEQVRLAENRVKMPKLNLESLSQFVIPLAPLAEQQRIVKKIDQLMSMCDTLEHQIDTARETQSAMLNAMMAQYGGQRCA
jgi:type I restriction enzyme S subunit